MHYYKIVIEKKKTTTTTTKKTKFWFVYRAEKWMKAFIFGIHAHEINSHRINSHRINSHEINSHKINFSRDQLPDQHPTKVVNVCDRNWVNVRSRGVQLQTLLSNQPSSLLHYIFVSLINCRKLEWQSLFKLIMHGRKALLYEGYKFKIHTWFQ